MLSWHFITSEIFNNATDAQKGDDKLFFLSDTKQIYRGKELFTEAITLYTQEPSVKAVGRVYVNSTTLEGKVWDGSKWVTVIHPVQAAIEEGDTTKPVSSKAVQDYVAEQIAAVTGSDGLVANVEYVEASNSLTVTMADGNSDTIPMTNVAADLVYDATTGLLQVKNAQGTTIGTGINLDLERFVKSATFDSATNKIILSFNDDQDPLEISVGDLVDTYTAKSSTTIQMTVTGNEFTAEAILSAKAGNQLVKEADGLYVAAIDISGKMDKDADATKDNIAIFDANGNAIDSGKSIGGETLAASPSVSVVATEIAVSKIREALQESIDAKMAKVGTGKADEIIVADENGDAKASGVKIGGGAFADAVDANTVATELGAKTYADSAIESALTWHTTI